MAALASFLDARSRRGFWYLRMEDLDPPRESPAAARSILHDLEALGLCWDGDVVYQSHRHAAYDAALASLAAAGQTFSCSCSRQELAEHQGRYPGTCRERDLPEGPGHAIRCRTNSVLISFTDRLQGCVTQALAEYPGDFVIKRKDGLHAYQLAVVVDDAWQGITHIVRGIDLLEATPRQIHLQHLLDLPVPEYAHIPVLVHPDGQKLSKQSFARAIDSSRPVAALYQALLNLQQAPDPQLLQADTDSLLAWAIANWRPQRLAGVRAVPEIAAPASPAV